MSYPSSIEFSQCPLCESKTSVFYSLKHVEIVKCNRPECGLVFSKTQPSDIDLEKLYNDYYYESESIDTSKAIKPNSDEGKFIQHIEFIKGKIDFSNSTILDYGCGVGNFMTAAKMAGAKKVLGVELNPRARKTAESRGFEVKENFNDHTQSIDLVYMNDVIEHLRDPVKTLIEIKNKLSDHGMIFIITLNIGGLKARLMKEKWDLITDPTHFYFYDKLSLNNTLIKAGFQHTSFENFYVDFGHHNVLRSFFQRLLVNFELDTGLKVMAYKKSPQ
jgi:2-polyprenyl-3-methyl-5-hydroxy-6-metoxy-1,4-benzoquinol methylase